MLDGSNAANVALVNATNLRNTEKAKLMSTFLNKIEYIKNFDVEDAAYTKTYDDIMLGEGNELSQEDELDMVKSILPADDEAEGISMPIVDSEVKRKKRNQYKIL